MQGGPRKTLPLQKKKKETRKEKWKEKGRIHESRPFLSFPPKLEWWIGNLLSIEGGTGNLYLFFFTQSIKNTRVSSQSLSLFSLPPPHPSTCGSSQMSSYYTGHHFRPNSTFSQHSRVDTGQTQWDNDHGEGQSSNRHCIVPSQLIIEEFYQMKCVRCLI